MCSGSRFINVIKGLRAFSRTLYSEKPYTLFFFKFFLTLGLVVVYWMGVKESVHCLGLVCTVGVGCLRSCCLWLSYE